MSNIRTSNRIIISATLLSVLFIGLRQIRFDVFGNIGIDINLLQTILVTIAAYILTLWVLHFRVTGERYISIALFPALGIFVFSLVIDVITANLFGLASVVGLLFVSSILFWGFCYVILATTNILNYSAISEIPLGQAARAAQFVLTLVIAYTFFVITFSNDEFIILRLILIAVVSFLLCFISLASLKISKRRRTLFGLVISLLLVFAGFILSIWPISAPYQALAITMIFYINLGIALETKEIISKFVLVEYSALYLIMMVFLILIAEWGINGHVF